MSDSVFLLDDCTFVENVASNRGGALFINFNEKIKKYVTDGNYILKNCFFHANKEDSNSSNDIFVAGNTDSVEHPFLNSFSTTVSNRVAGTTNHDEWLETGVLECLIDPLHANAKDSPGCGSDEQPCRTLEGAVENTEGEITFNLTLASTNHRPRRSVLINTLKIILKGKSSQANELAAVLTDDWERSTSSSGAAIGKEGHLATAATASSAPDSLFVITTGRLWCFNFSIVCSSAKTSLSLFLFLQTPTPDPAPSSAVAEQFRSTFFSNLASSSSHSSKNGNGYISSANLVRTRNNANANENEGESESESENEVDSDLLLDHVSVTSSGSSYSSSSYSSPFFYLLPEKTVAFDGFSVSQILFGNVPLIFYQQPTSNANLFRFSSFSSSKSNSNPHFCPNQASNPSQLLVIKHSIFSELSRSGQSGGCVLDESSSDCSVVIQNCTFFNCHTSQSSAGGCLRLQSKSADDSPVCLENCSFSVCKAASSSSAASRGKGGAIYLKIAEHDSFALKDLKFESNVAFIGKDIYFYGLNLSVDVTSASFPFALSEMYIKNRTNSLFGSDDTPTFENEDVNLYDFLITPSSQSTWSVFVSTTLGSDFLSCGSSSHPCSTFNYGMGCFGTPVAANRTISLKGSTECFACSCLSEPLAINGTDSDSSADADADVDTLSVFNFAQSMKEACDGGVALSIETNLAVSNVKFTFCSSINIEAGTPTAVSTLFEMKGERLNLHNCAFHCRTPTDAIAHSILNMRSGILSISGCNIAQGGISFSCSLISLADSITSASITSMNVSGVSFSSGSVLSTSFTSDTHIPVKFYDCIFNDVTSASSSSAVISSNGVSAIEMSNTELSGCVASASNAGGGLQLAFSVSGYLTMNGGCKVSGCQCSTTSGKGGGIYMRVPNTANTINLVDVTFANSNDAKTGTNLFVLSDYLNETVRRSAWGDWVEDWISSDNAFIGCNETTEAMYNLMLFLFQQNSSELQVRSDGIDALGCGTEIYPCKTLRHGSALIRKYLISIDSLADGGKLTQLDMQRLREPVDLSSVVVQSAGQTIDFTMPSHSDQELFWIVSSASAGFYNTSLNLPQELPTQMSQLIHSSPTDPLDVFLFDTVGITSNGELKYSLLLLSSGCAEINNCNWQSIKFTPAVSISSNEISFNRNFPSFISFSSDPNAELKTSLYIDNCTFSEITSSASPQGGCLYFFSTSGICAVCIKSTTISKCACNAASGYGGGLMFRLTVSPGSFELLQLNMQQNEASVGKHIYLECPEMWRVVNTRNWQFTACAALEPGNLRGLEIGGTDTIDLKNYLDPKAVGVMIVNVAGTNSLICGEDPMCKSLDYAILRYETQNEKSCPESPSASMENSVEQQFLNSNSYNLISVRIEATLEAAISPLLDFNISADNIPIDSSETKAKMFISNDISADGGLFTVNSAFCSKSIDYVLPSLFQYRVPSALFSLSKDTSSLTLDSCSVNSNDDTGSSVYSTKILFITDGKLNMAYCSIAQMKFSSSPFYIMERVEFTMKSVVIGSEPPAVDEHQHPEVNEASGIMINGASFFELESLYITSSSFRSSNSNWHRKANINNPFMKFENTTFGQISSEGSQLATLFSDEIHLPLSFSNCTLNSLQSSQSAEGGGMKLKLKDGSDLQINGASTDDLSSIAFCVCGGANGKGGFLYLDCGSSNSFLLKDLEFSGNEAASGKNIYVQSADLNTSINLQRFSFSLESWLNDENAFTGSDSNLPLIDLLMFLVERADETIFVSENGLDLLRCGTSVQPCASVWRGYKNVKADAEAKQLIINDSGFIQDQLDLSGFAVKSAVPSNKVLLAINKVIFSQVSSGEGYFIQDSLFTNTKSLSFSSVGFLLCDSFERKADQHLTMNDASLIASSSLSSSASSSAFESALQATIQPPSILITCTESAVNLSFTSCSFKAEATTQMSMQKSNHKHNSLAYSTKENADNVPIAYTLASLLGGCLYITDCSITDMSFVLTPFSFTSAVASVSISGSTLSQLNLQDSALFTLREVASSRQVKTASSASVNEDIDEPPPPAEDEPNELIITVSNTQITSVFRKSNTAASGGCFISSVCSGDSTEYSLFPLVSAIVSNCSFISCSALSSSEGGALCAAFHPDSQLFCIINSTVVLCAASNTNGKGGGLFINCNAELPDPPPSPPPSEPAFHSNSDRKNRMFSSLSQQTSSNQEQDPEDEPEPEPEPGPVIPSLNLLFDSIRFNANSASIGKDLFIVCHSIQKQVNETMFWIDFDDAQYDRSNSIWGEDEGEHKNTPIDLYPLILIFRSHSILISNVTGADGNKCGTEEHPCKTIRDAQRHWSRDPTFNLVLCDSADVLDTMSLSGVAFKAKDVDRIADLRFDSVFEVALEPEEAAISTSFVIKSPFLSTSSSNSGIFSTFEYASFESMNFLIGASFSSNFPSFFAEHSGVLSLSSCSFSSQSELPSLNGSLIRIFDGSLQMQGCSIRSLSFGDPVICGDLYVDPAEPEPPIHFEPLKNGLWKEISLSESDELNFDAKISIGSSKSTSLKNSLFNNASSSSFSSPRLTRNANPKIVLDLTGCSFINLTSSSLNASVIFVPSYTSSIRLSLCVFEACASKAPIGNVVYINGSEVKEGESNGVEFNSCIFDGILTVEENETEGEQQPQKNEIFTQKTSKINRKEQKQMNFYGSFVDEPFSSEGSDEVKCEWEDGAIFLSKCMASFVNTTVLNLPNGGIILRNSSASFEQPEFGGNGVAVAGFESMSHNVVCEEGDVSVLSARVASEEAETNSFWMIGRNCEMGGIIKEIGSYFFVPVLKTVGYAEEGDNIRLVFTGERLIPCDISFQIVTRCGSEENVQSFDFASFENETVAHATVPSSVLGGASGCSVFGRVAFNNKMKKPPLTELVPLTLLPLDDRETKAASIFTWSFIAFLVTAVVLIVFVIVVIVIFIRQRKKIKNLENGGKKDNREIEMQPELPKLRLLKTVEPFDEVELSDTTCLMQRIFAQQQREGEGEGEPGREQYLARQLSAVNIILRLAELFKDHFEREVEGTAKVAYELNPFTVTIGKDLDRDVYVKLEEGQGEEDGEDLDEWKRWLAPELPVGKGDEREKEKRKRRGGEERGEEEGVGGSNDANEEDYKKGTPKSVVYTLGLTLYSIVMMQKPYQNVTAGEARAAIMSGERPVMGDVPDSPLAKLMKSMWMQNPEDRIDLEKLVNQLKAQAEPVVQNGA
ncbi:uncharacterized protein MONOS_10175 [Monocercomonoides exilis]|uniref:uncharacterized protein n=1 Tax=Monocercomonoides exilis TaxID=2049356 RepID=UPI003559E95F|nr:hypothetical protein MONOS_10175 [Monocercomonoides exilis]|eukprot:MONOS_10175.1-p1 / transcript=MONOS_10175.1 / gene=MONOS_10175 / organism=Monocercomonoides_exilis_PA203 / gene_product=unspecified product / transcript_product=unspecified product / location=Mono_scaffold00451:21053-30670(+) / protein_length=3205 / sequence_SO=supercontig / SO=protein_coding / is_pseudo=false